MAAKAPPPPAPLVGLLLLSHGPLAEALRKTGAEVEPGPGGPSLSALSIDSSEDAAHGSRRLERALAAADTGRGVVVLTDMFGGTPSNLALAFLSRDRVEIVSGMNLPMVLKARALALEGKGPHEIAHELVEKGRKAIVAAAELLEERKVPTA